MKHLFKTLNVEIKDVDEEDRSFTAVASTEDIDRDNDRIMSSGWDLTNFLKNPVVPWAHRYGEPPVAKAEKIWIQDGKLMFKPKFPTTEEYPFGDTIYKLYKGGFLKAFSVGFWPKRFEVVERANKSRGYDLIETELWEISACTVPANPNALVAAVQKGVITEAESLKLKAGSEEKRLEIEERLEEMEKMIQQLKDESPEWIRKAIGERKLSDRLDDIEKKFDALSASLAKTQTATIVTTLEETKTPALDKAQVAEIVDAALEAAIGKLGALVDKKIKYHMGIID